MYILYDSRAARGDTSEASVLVTCEDDEEAKSYKGAFGAMCCFSYNNDSEVELTDERFEWNYYD